MEYYHWGLTMPQLQAKAKVLLPDCQTKDMRKAELVNLIVSHLRPIYQDDFAWLMQDQEKVVSVRVAYFCFIVTNRMLKAFAKKEKQLAYSGKSSVIDYLKSEPISKQEEILQLSTVAELKTKCFEKKIPNSPSKLMMAKRLYLHENPTVISSTVAQIKPPNLNFLSKAQVTLTITNTKLNLRYL